MADLNAPALLSWMDDSTRVRIGRVAGAVSVVLGAIGVVVLAVLGHWDFLFGWGTLVHAISAVGLGAVAWLVLPKEPRNGAVWALAWSAMFGAAATVGAAGAALFARGSTPNLAEAIEELSPSELPLGVAIGRWVVDWSWAPSLFVFFTLGFLLFPDGHLPAKGWRWVSWLSVGTIAAVSIGWAWLYWPTSSIPGDAPDEQYPWLGVLLAEGGFTLLLILLLLSVVALFRRYRRSASGPRSQIRLIAWGGAVFVTIVMAALIYESWAGTDDYELLFVLAGQIVFVSAFAAAILKHRLYDIDLIISKTVTYVSLATFIAAVYVGLVVGLSELVGGRSNFGLSIAASVIIAFAFQPLRRVVQRAANRLVYGERATPYEVLARFSHRATEASDEELLERAPRLVVDGTSAEQATLWIRDATGFLETTSWPIADYDQRNRRLSGEGFDDPASDHSVSIFHHGELLGGLSLVSGRGERISRADETLVADLAAGLGLALRNARLTGQLQRQVAELEASRERVLAASDDARRALENDLDSGPQQQLVALKVKLGPTRKLAERAGAEKTSVLLTKLELDAGEAIKAVRAFASGIYPPLLEAEGLTIAIGQQARNGAIHVEVHGHDVGRYPREVEAAVYFSVLEALQNIAKYSGADTATVTLTDDGDTFHFVVHDDGRGFDPAEMEPGAGLSGIADRLDTVGGKINIDSVPGEGTTVAGIVPIKQLSPA